MRVSKEYLKNYQYLNAENLSVRSELLKFGTNPESLWTWVAARYNIAPGSKILEVGCGSGEFWQQNLSLIPKDCSITLTDFSAGILEKAKKNLSQTQACQFEIADVEHLLYPDQTFDVVLYRYQQHGIYL